MKSAFALSAVLTVIGLSSAATLSAQQTSVDPAGAGAAAPAPAASETESSARPLVSLPSIGSPSRINAMSAGTPFAS